MRSALGFLSLLAFGFLSAGVLTVVSTGSGSLAALTGSPADGAGVDLASLLIGLVLGFVLSSLARVSWAELPGRFAGWLIHHERSFYRLVLAGLFLGILIYY